MKHDQLSTDLRNLLKELKQDCLVRLNLPNLVERAESETQLETSIIDELDSRRGELYKWMEYIHNQEYRSTANQGRSQKIQERDSDE